MAAQNPHAAGMEGADPDPLRSVSHDFIDTLTHFSGGLVRKGDRHNIPRIDAFVPDQGGDAVRQYPRLSRTGTCKDQKRPFGVLHSFHLHRV